MSGAPYWAVAYLPDGTSRGTFFTTDPARLLRTGIESGFWPEGTRIESGLFDGMKTVFVPVATREEFDRDLENSP